MQPQISPDARAELAPGGKLRVGINHSNFLIVTPGSPFGAPKGIAPELALELGKRAGVPVQFLSFDAAGKLADAVKNAQVDVGFLGNEPQRADVIAFSPAYLELPVTYLVPAGSPIAKLEEVDREGVRVAVSARSAYDLYLTRNLKHAQLVRAEGIPASAKLFVADKLEALAGLKPGLMEEARKLPGSRLLDGQVTAVQQSIGAPKNRQAAAAYLRGFVEDVKRSGMVRRLVESHGVKGVNVAPPA
ncbi:MAG: ABC transporter substrate-binding protein [Betaproteobacteria bacterium RIFCSPLOWO2_12_FULL_65_14]|nr:MAG: ABC transporter substrate-binding protein [Betaproteobacteria bacterium RIFCSPLOWO2_12_FULL_65_14]